MNTLNIAHIDPKEHKRFRTRCGLTQLEMSDLIGVHPMTISKIERGIILTAVHPKLLFEKVVWRGKRCSECLNQYDNPPPSSAEKEKK